MSRSLTFLGCSTDEVSVREVERFLQFELLRHHLLHPVAGVDVEPTEITIIFTSYTPL